MSLRDVEWLVELYNSNFLSEFLRLQIFLVRLLNFPASKMVNLEIAWVSPLSHKKKNNSTILKSMYVFMNAPNGC